MKKYRGFNLLELMVALTIITGLIAMMLSSFSQLIVIYFFNDKLLSLNHEMRLSMEVVKYDVANAGVFGNYSFHHQNPKTSFQKSTAISPQCNQLWCNFDIATVGVKSYYGEDTDHALSGYNVSTNSDVLRVQYGGNKLAYLNALDGSSCQSSNNCIVSKCPSDNKYYLNNLDFTNNGIVTKEGTLSLNNFMLTSANRAYQLNFSSGNGFNGDNLKLTTAGCPSLSKPSAEVYFATDSNDGAGLYYDSFDPDIHSMTLSNFYVSYFFVVKPSNNEIGGLYVARMKANGTIGTPELVSRHIDGMLITYILDNSANFNHAINSQPNRFTICSSAEMNTPDISTNPRCYNKWSNVVAMSINLSGSEKNTKNGDTIKQDISETVGWTL